jgi:predicted GNAT family acetyltransferase
MSRMSVEVMHRPELSRFEARPQGELALCSYRLSGRTLVIHHTEVPPALQGQGVAAELVRVALDWARQQGFQVQARCSYVAAYMRRHPETQDLLAG